MRKKVAAGQDACGSVAGPGPDKTAKTCFGISLMHSLHSETFPMWRLPVLLKENKMDGNKIMILGLALDIFGICMLSGQLKARGRELKTRKNKRPNQCRVDNLSSFLLPDPKK
ncbi:MAG: hypothetical protein OXG03_04975 [Gammaproteobacteria bacterium]|nr:hypothetical protein [Gammaproteobacteria bacterium]